MTDSPEQRVAVGSLSGKVNLGKIFFLYFSCEWFDNWRLEYHKVDKIR